MDRSLPASTKFYVDLHSKAAQQAVTDLKARDLAGAALMANLASYPGGTWFTGGTATDVRTSVAALEGKAAAQHQVPVVVAYDIPGRDCSQYSAGGAEGTADYASWIDGFATGVGNHKTVVILEPDGIALSPDQCGGTPEQQADRNTQMNAAVTRLEAQPKTIVYLDAGHSAWHAVGDIAQRLITAGVASAQGFFLNVSNYRTDAELARYGTEVSKCIWYIQNTPGGSGNDCANQYWPPADADGWYAAHVPATATLTHFVTDTSRNGQGPWTVPAGVYSDPQDWCNPPGPWPRRASNREHRRTAARRTAVGEGAGRVGRLLHPWHGRPGRPRVRRRGRPGGRCLVAGAGDEPVPAGVADPDLQLARVRLSLSGEESAPVRPRPSTPVGRGRTLSGHAGDPLVVVRESVGDLVDELLHIGLLGTRPVLDQSVQDRALGGELPGCHARGRRR